MPQQREQDAEEYDADAKIATAHYEFAGSESEGWTVLRNRLPWLDLGPGYRFLDVASCGVCSTDLARRFLPFPLPQVIGHEVVVKDDAGERYVVEINASCVARGLKTWCSFCERGLPTHCPQRLTIGIDRLPGGFGAGILAPCNALLPVPMSLPTETAVMVEPFAAALHAVEGVAPKAGEVIAVLGPRRLGMLALAALAAWRKDRGVDFKILALPRRDGLSALALAMGADEVKVLRGTEEGLADVVIDTTGHPLGLEAALLLAKREVHLKSTHGQAAAGLSKLTELVVDEIGIARADLDGELPGGFALSSGERPLVVWCSEEKPPESWRSAAQILLAATAAEAAAILKANPALHPLGRADAVVVDTSAQIDEALRYDAALELSLLRPRGLVLLTAKSKPKGALAQAVVERGLRLSSSRCGDFHLALRLLDSSDEFRKLGQTFVTHRFRRGELAEALRVAATPACIKAVVN
ncbi:MAG: alcohol dehydrogenase catalytic domain-containing protein [Planctomycetota bacterium]